jgi:predicted RNase H-related nuclease YkuK (DUF458 family)
MLNKENQMQIIEDGYGGNDDPIKTKAQKKVNVSVNPETMASLKELRDKLSGELGFSLSLAQVIQHLIKQNGTERIESDLSPNQGEANE